MGVRHLIPLMFVLSLIAGIIVIAMKIKILSLLFICEISLYLLLDIIFSFYQVNKSGFKKAFLKLLIYPIFHISYGIGSILGIGLVIKRKFRGK